MNDAIVDMLKFRCLKFRVCEVLVCEVIFLGEETEWRRERDVFDPEQAAIVDLKTPLWYSVVVKLFVTGFPRPRLRYGLYCWYRRLDTAE